MYREAVVIGDRDTNTAFAEVQGGYRHVSAMLIDKAL